jgi:hypothetical protein
VTSPAPRIGIDRFLNKAWMSMASEVVRGETSRADLDARLAMDLPAKEVRIKTSGILNRIWFPADDARQKLSLDAAEHIAKHGDTESAVAFTAVTIAAYPFFGEVFETVGRLITIQGSCSAGEVHRRMFERHGQSRTISLTGARVFRTMTDWGIIQRGPKQRLMPARPAPVGKAGRALMDRGANLFRNSITPLNNADPLLPAPQHASGMATARSGALKAQGSASPASPRGSLIYGRAALSIPAAALAIRARRSAA